MDRQTVLQQEWLLQESKVAYNRGGNHSPLSISFRHGFTCTRVNQWQFFLIPHTVSIECECELIKIDYDRVKETTPSTQGEYENAPANSVIYYIIHPIIIRSDSQIATAHLSSCHPHPNSFNTNCHPVISIK